MRNEIKGFGTIVPEILSEICEDPTYARFTVYSDCTHDELCKKLLAQGQGERLIMCQ